MDWWARLELLGMSQVVLAGRLGEMVLTTTVLVPVHDMLRSVLPMRSPILLYRFLPLGFTSPPTNPWDDKAL
jgi:hypothetical protein